LIAHKDAVPSTMVPEREAGGGDETLALSIVIPAFNEGSRLKSATVALVDAIAAGAIDPSATELILVDDGSTDDTGQQAVDCLGPSFPLMRVLRARLLLRWCSSWTPTCRSIPLRYHVCWRRWQRPTW
jgi:hypothetical protein